MKGKSRNLKQSTLFQFSSPEKSSPVKPPPSSPVIISRRRIAPRRPSVLDYDSDNIQAIRLEKVSSSSSSASSASPSDEDGDSGDDDDDAPVATPSVRRTRPNTIKSESEAGDSDSDSLPLDVLKKRIAARAKRLASARSDSDDSEDAQSSKRTRLSHHRTYKVHAVTDEDSSHNELDDLDPERIIEPRFRKRKMSAYQKNLEKLKRRKQKKAGGLPSEDESENDEEESGEEARPIRPFKGAKKDVSGSQSEEDDDEEEEEEEDNIADFIEEDDGEGAPVLPATFSMSTHQDLSAQFKTLFQLFVHVAVHPVKERKAMMAELLKKEYFSIPLFVARRKLSGLRDSLVASSTWKPEFKRALERFPVFELTALDLSVPGCDACHLGSRLSTRRGALSGAPYDRIGFCKLEKHSSSDSENSDSDSDSDSDEETFQKEFDLGRFCASRTQVFHEFCHWEHHTFEAIELQVSKLRSDQESDFGFHTVAWAGGTKPPQDILNDPDGLVDWLDERDISTFEWQRIKGLMDRARKLDSESRRGGED